MTIPQVRTSFLSNTTSPISPNSPLSPVSTLTSHFVQALHDYLPTNTDDGVVSCLFFKKGSIIEVLNRDHSGWWDGQIGGIRGWFPSNYVGRIGEAVRSDFEEDHELELWRQKHVSLEENTKIRDTTADFQITTNLMDEIAQKVSDLVDSYAQPSNNANIQLNVFRVVSCVRSLLTHVNMVDKESPLLKIYPELARQRKIVLSALSRLILKGKEFQSENAQQVVVDQISYLADRLLNEIDIFENMFATMSSSSFFQDGFSTTSTTTVTTELNNSSSSSLLLRQPITEARHSNGSISTISITGDIDHILQVMLDHQTTIDELMSMMTLEREQFNKASEMLELTRRVVDAVRSFLSVIEYVCSNVSDYHRRSFEEDDSSELIALVLAKEYVYTSITNLVTAVRAFTSNEKQDSKYLETCCENVIHTTNECAACVRICLESMRFYETSSDESILDYKELNVLGKKISSLKALQQVISPQEQEEVNQYRKELRDSVRSVDSLRQVVKPSISDSAIQSRYKKDSNRPRAASLDSLYQLSKISSHPMAAAFPLPPPIEDTSNISTKEDKKKESDHAFLQECMFSPDEMTFNAEGEVTGATVEALIKKLTLHEKSPDLIFTKAFFYNFRIFTSPDIFLDLLKKRFTLSPPLELNNDEQVTLWKNRVLLPIRLRVYNVIKTWLENYFNFEQDASIEQELLDFVKGEMEVAMPGPAKRMVELVNKTFSSKGLTCTGRKHTFLDTRLSTAPILQKNNSNPFPTNGNSNLHISLGSSSLFSNWSLSDHNEDFEKPPTPIITRSLRNNLRKALHQNMLQLVHIHDIDAIELARQMTVMEHNLFCRIRPSEVMSEKRAAVKAMIQRSTQITNWVCDTILKEIDTKKRVQMLKYWIKVGDACLQLNNYNTLMAIRSALDSTSIIRLRKTWDHLSAKYRSLWEPIYRATDSQRNFAEYRQRLKTAVAPCLPFLGVYLTDLTFIQDGNPDFRMYEDKKLINFDKYIKVTRVLNDIDQFQIGYRFLEIDEIQTFVMRTLEIVEMDDQVFYTMSLKREPKEDHLESQ